MFVRPGKSDFLVKSSDNTKSFHFVHSQTGSLVPIFCDILSKICHGVSCIHK